uniref:Putative secreted protein n=1 Tax=Anopheles triannulatus TaxID=58253 RepID=A0A2M4B1L1_9DIPT
MTWAYSTFSSARMVSMLISGLLFTFRSARLERYSFSISCDRLSRAAASSIAAADRYSAFDTGTATSSCRNSGPTSGRKCARLSPLRSYFVFCMTLGVAR